MTNRLASALGLVLLTARALCGMDVYVVRGSALGPILPDGNTYVLWTTEAYLYNTSTEVRTVTLLGGGTPGQEHDALMIAPHSSVSLVAVKSLWPDNSKQLSVLHLDAPPDVLIESVLFIGSLNSPNGPPLTNVFRFGKTRLPVVKALVPAGQPQAHLATSLGRACVEPCGPQVSSRLNVSVYNAASVPASAIIEIRQHCDDRLISSRAVTIPAETIIQFGGFDTRTIDCPSAATTHDGNRLVYTVVTSDQPGFSFVSNLNNEATPTTGISITSMP